MLIRSGPLALGRIARIGRSLTDLRDRPENLVFSSRLPVVDINEGDLTAYADETVSIAEVYPDDARARVLSGGELKVVMTEVPNIKQGRSLSQSDIAKYMEFSRVAGLEAAPATGSFEAEAARGFLDMTGGKITSIDKAIAQQRELMAVGLALGTYSFATPGGIAVAVQFDRPADLTVGFSDWSTPAAGKPITDLEGFRHNAMDVYGRTYDRLTLNLATFQDMVQTEEFAQRAKLVAAATLLAGGDLPTSNRAAMISLFEQITGLMIEIYDRTYQLESLDNVKTRQKFLPYKSMIFTDSADDNDSNVADFGNVPVIEAMVAGIVNDGQDVGQARIERGPHFYATGNPSLNPPDLAIWGVQRGFPRLHDRTAYASASY